MHTQLPNKTGKGHHCLTIRTGRRSNLSGKAPMSLIVSLQFRAQTQRSEISVNKERIETRKGPEEMMICTGKEQWDPFPLPSSHRLYLFIFLIDFFSFSILFHHHFSCFHAVFPASLFLSFLDSTDKISCIYLMLPRSVHVTKLFSFAAKYILIWSQL
jgi:hypothetical protein